MRELSFEDVQQVSGGSDTSDAFAYLGAGLAIATAAGIVGASVVGAFALSPLAALASLGLFATGGYKLGGGIPTVTIGPDFVGGGNARESDC